MLTSIGYHTFAISMNLMQEEADLLFKDFKKYRDNTNEICIIKKEYDIDPSGRHYIIVYPNQEKGISWKLRFSNRAFFINGEFMTCTIKAIINPKILVGEKTYIVAATAAYLKEVEKIFNQEAEKISLLLRKFHCYTLNRLDYCINFDVSELILDCYPYSYPSELKKELPKFIMKLIKNADIPEHFSEQYKDEFQFYLKSNSVVINCYWKYDDLSRNFSECQDLESSQNIIRFEVQYKYPKVFKELKDMKRRQERIRSILIQRGKKQEQGYCNSLESYKDKNYSELKQTQEAWETIKNTPEKSTLIEDMLSDYKCIETIHNYFYKVVKIGNYYTFKEARRIIERNVSKWEKIVRLTNTLKLIHQCGGIAKVKASLQGKALEEFRMSLRDLAALRINPVIIPKDWGISYIPDLLGNYYDIEGEEVRKIQLEEENKNKIFEDYIADCKKHRKSKKKHLLK